VSALAGRRLSTASTAPSPRVAKTATGAGCALSSALGAAPPDAGAADAEAATVLAWKSSCWKRYV
jgi:hypothetical protein